MTYKMMHEHISFGVFFSEVSILYVFHHHHGYVQQVKVLDLLCSVCYVPFLYWWKTLLRVIALVHPQ